MSIPVWRDLFQRRKVTLQKQLTLFSWTLGAASKSLSHVCRARQGGQSPQGLKIEELTEKSGLFRGFEEENDQKQISSTFEFTHFWRQFTSSIGKSRG